MTIKYIPFLYFFGTLLIACTTNKPQLSEQTLTLKGTYESKQGVMVALSCYCGNGGYLTTSDCKNIPVCLESTDNVMDCKNIIVTGFYTTVKNNPEPTNPCKQGEMTYFKAVNFKCF